MRIFLISLLLASTASWAAGPGGKKTATLERSQKAQLVTIYRDFLREWSRQENNQLGEFKKTSYLMRMLMDEAWAADPYDCFFAGWPSKLAQSGGKNFCSNPAKNNSTYQSKYSSSCGAQEMLCNPALFGKDLCVQAGSAEQRRYAFSNCERQFKSQNRTAETVAADLKDDLATEFDALAALADQVCATGVQAATPMCGNLKTRVAAVTEKKVNEAEILASANVSSNSKQVVVANEIPLVVTEAGNVQDPQVKGDFAQAISTVKNTADIATIVSDEVANVCNNGEENNRSTASVIVAPEDAEDIRHPEERSEPIDQNRVTPDDYCSGGEEGNENDKFFNSRFWDSEKNLYSNVTWKKNRTTGESQAVGASVDTENFGVARPYIEGGETYPEEIMRSGRDMGLEFDDRGKDNNLTIVDTPVKEIYDRNGRVIDRYTSTDIRITSYYFFPRNQVPALKTRDDGITMTLTTGEKINLDRNTGRIVGGVATEVPAANPVETRPNNKRFYPETDFAYRGKGLFIESRVLWDRDERSPGHTVPVKAWVDGRWQVCKLKSDDLFVKNFGYRLPQGHEDFLRSYWSCTKLKVEKDEDLYGLVRTKCPSFKFPELATNPQPVVEETPVVTPTPETNVTPITETAEDPTSDGAQIED